METENIKSAVEAILFAAGEPVPTARISLILEVSEDAVLAAAKELADEYSFNRRGVRILTLDNKLQMCSSPEYAAVISKTLEQRKPPMLSQPALETLAVVATAALSSAAESLMFPAGPRFCARRTRFCARWA